MAKKDYTPILLLGGLAAAGFWYASKKKPLYSEPSVNGINVGHDGAGGTGWMVWWKGSTPLLGLPPGRPEGGLNFVPGNMYGYRIGGDEVVKILSIAVPYDQIDAAIQKFIK